MRKPHIGIRLGGRPPNATPPRAKPPKAPRDANDTVAREFFARHYWLNAGRGGPQAAFWTVCFLPIFAQILLWNWWRKRMGKKQVDQ